MELEEAILILNRHKHRGENTYELNFRGDIVKDIYSDNRFTVFETIAIAEKYKRDSQ